MSQKLVREANRLLRKAGCRLDGRAKGSVRVEQWKFERRVWSTAMRNGGPVILRKR